jgi:anti-sigma B factor antagonist
VTRPQSASFTLQFQAPSPGVQIATLGGAVALAQARELERGVIEGLRDGRVRVVLDLTEVTDVGPGLLGVLLRIRRGITQVGGRLAMVAAGPPVDELVGSTLLASLVDVTADQQQALMLVGARSSR